MQGLSRFERGLISAVRSGVRKVDEFTAGDRFDFRGFRIIFYDESITQVLDSVELY